MEGLPINFVRKQVKEGRAWKFVAPDAGDDMIYQIFFKQPFADLMANKKIARLVDKLEELLSDDKFKGEFSIEVIPEVKSVCIIQKGFWKNFATKPEEFCNAVEAACEAIL